MAITIGGKNPALPRLSKEQMAAIRKESEELRMAYYYRLVDMEDDIRKLDRLQRAIDTSPNRTDVDFMRACRTAMKVEDRLRPGLIEMVTWEGEANALWASLNPQDRTDAVTGMEEVWKAPADKPDLFGYLFRHLVEYLDLPEGLLTSDVRRIFTFTRDWEVMRPWRRAGII